MIPSRMVSGVVSQMIPPEWNFTEGAGLIPDHHQPRFQVCIMGKSFHPRITNWPKYNKS